MKLLKRLSTLSIAAVMLFTQTAYALEADPNYASGTLTISGVAAESGYLNLIVLKEGKTFDDYKAIVDTTGYLNTVLTQIPLTVTAQETYSVTLNPGTTEGNYTAVAYMNGPTPEDVIAAPYYDMDVLFTRLLEEKAKGYDEFKAFLLQYQSAFGLDFDLSSELSDQESVYNILFTQSFNDADELKTYYRLSVIVAVLNTKTATDAEALLKTYSSDLGIDTSDTSELMTMLDDEYRAKVYSAIAARDYTSAEEVKTEFNTQVLANIEALFLNKIHSASYWSLKKDAVEKYINYLTLNMTGFAGITKSQSEFYNMLTGPYSTFAEFETAFNTAVTACTAVSVPGGSGGGGGYSSGGKIPSVSVVGGVDKITPQETQKPQQTEQVFNDMTGFEWAQEAVNELVNKKVIAENEEKKFRPSDKITREEFVKLAAAAAGIESKTGDKFKDVINTEWYAGYVYGMNEAGIVNGISETLFGIGQNITRQDAAVIINNIVGELEDRRSYAEFYDEAEIAEYAKPAVQNLYSAYILSGSDNNFNPRANCTRAEAAIMIKKMMEEMK